MFGAVLAGGELVRGIPSPHLFVPSGTPSSVVWIGPCPTFSQTPPTLASVGNGAYSTSLYASEYGHWTLLVLNSSGSVIYQAQFRCDASTERQRAYQVCNPCQSLVISDPSLTYSQASATSMTNNGTAIKSYVSTGKLVAPMTGLVRGIGLWTINSAKNLKQLNFFTMDPSTTKVRGISDNIIASGAAVLPVATGVFPTSPPTSTLYSSSWTWHWLWFNVPVPVRVGDYYGLVVDDTTAGGTTAFLQRFASNANTATNQQIKISTGALNLTGTNTLVQYGPSPTTDNLGIQLLYAPPTIAVAGHSFWAGAQDSSAIYADQPKPFYYANDLAYFVEQLLGLPCVNCAWGGSDIRNWVGSATDSTTSNSEPVGMFEKIVHGLHPKIMFFDTVYNDANNGFGQENLSGFTSANYRTYLERLKVHADQAGVELVFLEAPGSASANSLTAVGGVPFNAQIDKLNGQIADWCQRSGIPYVPLQTILGEYSGASGEARWSRWTQKAYSTSNPSWGLPNYEGPDTIHLTPEGRRAAGAQLAQLLEGRSFREPRLLRSPGSLTDNLPQPNQVSGNTPTAAAIASAVLTDTTDTGTVGSLGYQLVHAPSWYVAPSNPTDYARAAVAPSWWVAPPSAAAIAAAVLTDTTDTGVVGSLGYQLGHAPSWYVAPSNPTDYARSNAAPSWWVAPDNADVAAIAGAVATVKAKTDQLAFDRQGNVFAIVEAYAPGQDPWGGILTTVQAGAALLNSYAVLAGDLTESADHSTSSFASPLDGTTVLVTSSQTPTGRTVTIH